MEQLNFGEGVVETTTFAAEGANAASAPSISVVPVVSTPAAAVVVPSDEGTIAVGVVTTAVPTSAFRIAF